MKLRPGRRQRAGGPPVPGRLSGPRHAAVARNLPAIAARTRWQCFPRSSWPASARSASHPPVHWRGGLSHYSSTCGDCSPTGWYWDHHGCATGGPRAPINQPPPSGDARCVSDFDDGWRERRCQDQSQGHRTSLVALTQAADIEGSGADVVDMKLEIVVVPVADVDRAKDFYEALGWREDADFTTGEDFRVVQLTPPGSACSVIFGTGITSAAPGSAHGLQLVVDDIDAARAELGGRGAGVSEVFHDAGGCSTMRAPPGRSPARHRSTTATARGSRSPTRTGRTGTRSTWWTSRPGGLGRPGRERAHERLRRDRGPWPGRAGGRVDQPRGRDVTSSRDVTSNRRR